MSYKFIKITGRNLLNDKAREEPYIFLLYFVVSSVDYKSHSFLMCLLIGVSWYFYSPSLNLLSFVTVIILVNVLV